MMLKTIAACTVGLFIVTLVIVKSVAMHGADGAGFTWTNPESKFNTNKNITNQSTIVWKAVDNLQETCERESRKRGNNGFGYQLEACSFWTGNSCTIFTSKMTSLHTLGHETLHCFQGNYH
jgi:hypothetical protein